MKRLFTFSASLLDPRHTATSAGSGFILEVPAENILATRPSDMNSPLSRIVPKSEAPGLALRDYDRTLARYPVLDPGELLAKTDPADRNELMIAGTTPEGGSVRIAGLFVMRHRGKEFVGKRVLALVRAAAKNLRVPLIELDSTVP
jgi:hypothetical protein